MTPFSPTLTSTHTHTLHPGGHSLTHVVSVRGLGGSVLQARQDLALSDVAVPHQQELEQKVVRPGRAASVAHPRGRWQLSCPIMRWDPAAWSLTPSSPPLTPGSKARRRERETRKVRRNKSATVKLPPRSTTETLRVFTCNKQFGDPVQIVSGRATSVQCEPPTPIKGYCVLCAIRAHRTRRAFTHEGKNPPQTVQFGSWTLDWGRADGSLASLPPSASQL